jgi:hypothetical protein
MPLFVETQAKLFFSLKQPLEGLTVRISDPPKVDDKGIT